MEKIFLYYLIFINLLSMIICAVDKIKAGKHMWRISEKTLWLLSFIGGSIGMYITMLMIRHKTLHKRFMIGLPVLIIIQIVLIFMLTNTDLRNIMQM